jgi:hypothetical protein
VTSLQVLESMDSTWEFPLQISLTKVCLYQGGVSSFRGCDWPRFYEWQGEHIWLHVLRWKRRSPTGGVTVNPCALSRDIHTMCGLLHTLWTKSCHYDKICIVFGM